MTKIKAPPPNSIIAGKYRVEGMIGLGGMGVVLSAIHQQLDQKVAIKVLLPEVSKHPEVLERFAREARAAAKIQGEHVARVLDVGELEDGSPFMVMEYLEGRDLSAEVRLRGGLPWKDVAHWIVEACDAIAQAHAARIVHRDLKPSNLFLAKQPDGRYVVKVLDFGISKIVDLDAPSLTKTSSIVGTPYYMSPEQLTAAKTVDTRADVWALGVIMYELLIGTPPFNGESMPEVVGSILMNQPKSLTDLNPAIPAKLAEVVAKCMQTKPDDRLQDVAAVAALLAPFGEPHDQERAERIARVLRISKHPLATTTAAPDTDAPTEAAPAVGSHASGNVLSAEPVVVTAKTLPFTSSGPGPSGPSGAPAVVNISPSAHTRAAPAVSTDDTSASDRPAPIAISRAFAADATMSSSNDDVKAMAKSVAAVASAAPPPEELKPKSNVMTFVAIAAVAIAIGGGAVIGLSKKTATTMGGPSSGGVESADATTALVSTTTTPSSSASSSSSSMPPAPSTTPSASASTRIVATNINNPLPNPPPSSSSTKTSTHPSSSAAVATGAPPPSATPPATSASVKTNPLDMVIK